MSGGYYGGPTIPGISVLAEVANDDRTMELVPDLCELFERLDKVVSEIIHDLDYHLSGDTKIENARFFEDQAIRKLRQLFPPDEIDYYDAVCEVVKRARRLDGLKKLKADAEDAFNKMTSVLSEEWMQDDAKVRWLYTLLGVAKRGEAFHHGAFASEPFNVQLLADWQIKKIEEEIKERS